MKNLNISERLIYSFFTLGLLYSTPTVAMDEKDELKQVIPHVKKEIPQEEFPYFRLLIDLPASPLSLAVREHQRIVVPYQHSLRRRFIAERAQPPFYAVSYKGIPLGVFICETIHNLSFEVLPPYIVRCINAIASSKGSRLFPEIVTPIDDNFKIDKFFNDSRILLDSEMRKKYPDGKWTNLLTPETQKRLQALLSEAVSTHVDINNLNPESPIVQNVVVQLMFPPMNPCVELDHTIKKIFRAHRRRCIPLENEVDRAVADLGESHNLESSELIMTDSTKSETLETSFRFQLEALEDFLAQQEHVRAEQPVYRPTLNDLNFSDQTAMNYLEGQYTQLAVDDRSVMARNDHWWNKTIGPLLKTRLSAKQGDLFPPCLLMYGQGHNQGSSSILEKIIASGCRLHLLTRQGWQEWTLGKQAFTLYKHAPLPTDTHGRWPGHRNYGELLSDADLPDQYNRPPGHPHHGWITSPSELDELDAMGGKEEKKS